MGKANVLGREAEIKLLSPLLGTEGWGVRSQGRGKGGMSKISLQAPGMLAHICNLSTLEVRQEFEAA